MSKKRSYFTASKKSQIAIAAVEGKLTQAQITSEYGGLNANRRFFRTLLTRLPSRKLWKISSFLANIMLIKNRNHSLTIYLS